MKKIKQITAIIAIIILIGIYIATFVTAITSNINDMRPFAICLFATIAVPLLSFAFIFVFGRTLGKDIIGDPVQKPDANEEKSASKEDT